MNTISKDAITAFSMASMGLNAFGPKDIVSIKWNAYSVDPDQDYSTPYSGHRGLGDGFIELEAGPSVQYFAERLTAQLEGIDPDVPPFPNPRLDVQTFPNALNVTLAPSKKKLFEVALSNKISVKFEQSKEWTPISLIMLDYKATDELLVRNAMARQPSAFLWHTFLKTKNSYHVYGMPDHLSQTTSQFLGTALLTQGDVLDLNWLGLSLVNDECFLRVTENYKGPITALSYREFAKALRRKHQDFSAIKISEDMAYINRIE